MHLLIEEENPNRVSGNDKKNDSMKQYPVSFFIVVSVCFLNVNQALGVVCYDSTTDHQCAERRPPTTKGSFNNENLRRNYKRQISIDALNSRLFCDSQATGSEQNVQDIFQAIKASQLNNREKFVCNMEVKIREQTQYIISDRKFIKEYINKKKSKAAVSESDKVKMTSLLIKYRLLENKKQTRSGRGICGSYATGDNACYFSSARFDVPSEVFKRIDETAKQYVEQYGEPHCFFNRTEYPLSSAQCEEELLSRVQPIPSPLILAQMAQESGWGDSQWASDYNNFFGLQIQFQNPRTMSCYKNCRCAGATKSRCALRFTDFSGCFYEYSMRFNASPNRAYQKFRDKRKGLSNMNKLSDITSQCENARALVPHLTAYAEDEKYITHVCNGLNRSICKMLKKCPKFNMSLTSTYGKSNVKSVVSH